MKHLPLALALALTLMGLAQVAPSAAAPADSCNFSRRIGYRLELLPPGACAGRHLQLVIRSCAECDHILSGALADDGTLYLNFLSSQVCVAGVVCRDDSLVIALPDSLSPGFHTIHIQAHASVITSLPDTTVCDIQQNEDFVFQVQDCPPPSGTLPFVRDVQIADGPGGVICPRDSIPVSIYVEMPSPCFRFLGLRVAPSLEPVIGPPVVEILVDACPACFYCPPEPIPYVAKVVLPPLPLGAYHLRVREVWSGQVDSTFTGEFPFSVVDACSTGAFPFVNLLQVGTPPCPNCPPHSCADDSIAVLIAGQLPSPCWEFKGFEFPSDSLGGPRPPTVTAIFSRNGCIQVPCAAQVVPFARMTRLPPLPVGAYTLHFEERQVVDCGPRTSFFRDAAFEVAADCSTGTSACLIEAWEHGADRCDTHVAPDHPGSVRMSVQSTTSPLSGVQGELHFLRVDLGVGPLPIQITNLEPVGDAASWKIAWTHVPDGAKFLMFSTDGSTIPPGITRVFRPALKVTVSQVGPGTPPSEIDLAATNLMGADPQGQQVPPCPMLDRFALPTAHICTSGRLCDFNHDGISDIRDLVLMVNCLFGYGACSDTSTTALDCDGNHEKTIDDLFCCARAVLRGGMPDTTLRRHEPGVQVSFGAPVLNGGHLTVPIRVDGADRLGAGRLVLRFPSDRFDLGSVETASSDWIALGEADGSDLVVGLIGLRGPALAVKKELGTVMLRLNLELKAGQQAGGDLRLATGEFSGPDGAALEVPLSPAVVPMDGIPRLVLAAPQPNPFSRETRFSVTLPSAAGNLDVTVHDLAGRRVATLFRGGLATTPTGSLTVPIRWAGTDDSGARVRDGIYFLHVRSGRDEVTGKIILLRGR